MSWRLFSIGADAEVPTQSHRLVLLKLVDCCDDDGRNIFPAVATVARFAKCSTRQVQRVVKEFCQIGLLRRVREGGQGRKSTAHYEMDIDLLCRLRRAELYPALIAAASVDPLPDDDDDGESHAESACEDGNDGSDSAHSKGDTLSPLDADRVTPATAKGDKLSHPTPYRTLKPEREGAQAQAGQPASTGDASDAGHALDAGQTPTIAEFRKVWPTAGIDIPSRVENAWNALSFSERRAAVDGVPAFLAELKRINRKHLPAGSTYLAERLWRNVPAMAAERQGAAFVEVKGWSKDWWLLLHLAIADGNRGRVGVLVQQAEAHGSFSPKAADLAAAARRIGELREFIGIGPEMNAWRPWLAARGARIPVFSNPNSRVFLPSEWPPGGRRAEGDDDVRL